VLQAPPVMRRSPEQKKKKGNSICSFGPTPTNKNMSKPKVKGAPEGGINRERGETRKQQKEGKERKKNRIRGEGARLRANAMWSPPEKWLEGAES